MAKNVEVSSSELVVTLHASAPLGDASDVKSVEMEEREKREVEDDRSRACEICSEGNGKKEGDGCAGRETEG